MYHRNRTTNIYMYIRYNNFFELKRKTKQDESCKFIVNMHTDFDEYFIDRLRQHSKHNDDVMGVFDGKLPAPVPKQ